MTARGVLFAIDDEEQDRLDAAEDDATVRSAIEELEEEWKDGRVFETDKAWDAIHRALTDGRLEYDNGDYPLKLCILGGYQLHQGESYIASVTPAEDVPNVAEALRPITKLALRHGYDRIDPETYDGQKGDEDFEYTWSNFEGLCEFYQRAAAANHAVVFTVDL